MYQHELARSGEALFKIRGHYLTAVVIVGAMIAYHFRAIGPFATESANQAWFWVSLAVASAGALIRIITSGFAALGTSGNSKDAPVAAELNTTGPYSLVRNPLYVGRILNFTGIAMLSGSWVYGALVFLISVIVYERVAVFEEEFLRTQFPEAHAAWAAKVPFLLPRLHGWLKPKYPFWVRRCIRRENKKLFWLATALLAYDFARRGFDFGQLPENPVWYYAWAVLALVSLAIHLLRRFTKTFADIS
jgi:protein-S-isoprenylcysteine O-methyltransferase Ste14